MIRRSWPCKNLDKGKCLEVGIWCIDLKMRERPLWLVWRTRNRRQDEVDEPANTGSLYFFSNVNEKS